jgi:predicted transcriptional regulator YdeE
MYLAKAPEDLILRKTRINKLQLLKVIAKNEKVPKCVKTEIPSLEYEVVEMRKEIKELKTTVSELVEMIKAIYHLQDT